MPCKVFINYRRKDSSAYAMCVRLAMQAEFGPDQVFLDTSSIEAGAIVEDDLRAALESAEVLLVMIGKRWLSSTAKNGRHRLESEDDWVRVEIETAFRRKILVVPVLVDDASRPEESALPRSLADLSKRQAHVLKEISLENDLRELVHLVRRHVGSSDAMEAVNDSARKPIGERAEVLARSTESAAREAWPDYDKMRRLLDKMDKPGDSINRVYAVDYLDHTIWAAPPAYYWLALQARQFVKMNYRPSPPESTGRGSWEIRFSREVLEALRRSLNNLGKDSQTQLDDRVDGKLPFLDEPGTPTCEIARILVWERKWLLEDHVKPLIVSHSAFNIPLYFVDRGWAEKEGLNLDAEYLLLGRVAEGPETPKAHLEGQVWHKRESGHSDLYTESFRYSEIQPFEHFFKLLRCPQILFAADARALAKEERLDAFLAGISAA